MTNPPTGLLARHLDRGGLEWWPGGYTYDSRRTLRSVSNDVALVSGDDGDDRHRERVARRFAEHPLDLLGDDHGASRRGELVGRAQVEWLVALADVAMARSAEAAAVPEDRERAGVGGSCHGVGMFLPR
jgi:hypothetical protein